MGTRLLISFPAVFANKQCKTCQVGQYILFVAQVSEGKASGIEESYSEQLHSLKVKYDETVERAESAERSVQKLQGDVLRLENDLDGEQGKCRALEDEMKNIMNDLNSI